MSRRTRAASRRAAIQEGPKMHQAKTSGQIQCDVRKELEREPSIEAAAIGVTAESGIVHLSGHVLGATLRQAVEEAALRVEGVTAVVDVLKIRPGCSPTRDSILASLVVGALGRDFGKPDHPVKVVVRGGKVRLVGLVPGPGEREAAEAAVLQVIGPASLENAIIVEPAGTPETGPPPGGDASGPVDPHDDRRVDDEPRSDGASPDPNMMIVVSEGYPGQVVRSSLIHHRKFPEVCVTYGGRDDPEGVDHLAHLLDQSRGDARDDWHLEAIERAIDDVRAFRTTLYGGAEGGGRQHGPPPQLLQVIAPPLSEAIP